MLKGVVHSIVRMPNNPPVSCKGTACPLLYQFRCSSYSRFCALYIACGLYQVCCAVSDTAYEVIVIEEAEPFCKHPDLRQVVAPELR